MGEAGVITYYLLLITYYLSLGLYLGMTITKIVARLEGLGW